MSGLYNIGDIQEALGFKITAEFITEKLGIQPHSTDKRAKFFDIDGWHEIKQKLAEHLDDCTIHAKVAKAAAPAAPATKKAAPKPVASDIDDDDDDL
jgi:hypothetical protein